MRLVDEVQFIDLRRAMVTQNSILSSESGNRGGNSGKPEGRLNGFNTCLCIRNPQ